MDDAQTFQTMRLSGVPPRPGALPIYDALFDGAGESNLDRDIQDWRRHQIAPWTLRHAGQCVGVGGFRLGFGEDGLEIVFRFLPAFWGQGLASEFLTSALDHARRHLKEDRFFGYVPAGQIAARRVLEKAGFKDAGARADDSVLMRC
ncbi:GNAT family N-acetyltransferase [Hasllibacter sp. MH4015]|uniref:GNAT family N-acetyltransferase n=1 Tax=Hasllibacter sp. MH4015 TaxID=2854029 RepID=UPI001CD35348|nr:GNAT family N-acetyltransferase [Hasllibacter sp. MH4015]